MKELRPAGCTSALGRTFEHLLLNEMQRTVPVFDNFQFGFKKGKSTSDAILVLLDQIVTGLDAEETTLVRTLFLDFTSAFNTVSRLKFLDLLSNHVPVWVLETLKFYLTGVTQTVRFGRLVSSARACDTGVLQGGVLSPYLFGVAVSQLSMTDPRSALIKYADDNTLSHTVRTKEHMLEYRKKIKHIEEWAKENHLILNGSKTKEVIFLQHGVTNPTIVGLANERITVAGIEIEPSHHVKYLGILIDDRLSFGLQMEAVVNKCTRVLHYAIKLLRCSGSRLAVRDFVQACALSILLYGLPTYDGFLSEESKRQLKSILRRAAYLIGEDPKEIIHQFFDRNDSVTQKLVTRIRKSEDHPLRDKMLVNHRALGPNTRSQRTIFPRVRTALAQKSLIYRCHLETGIQEPSI